MSTPPPPPQNIDGEKTIKLLRKKMKSKQGIKIVSKDPPPH